MDGVEIYGIESIRLLAAKLGGMPLELRAKLKPTVLEAGQLVAGKAQENASWSSRIPGAITVAASFTANAGALVRVNATKAPHARPYEGVGTRGGTFRHPVYGNTDVWVTEGTRPFLFPALSAKRGGAMALIAKAVKSVTTI